MTQARPFPSTGGFVVHRITGNFKGRISAWFSRDGTLLDAEQYRGTGAYPVRKGGPLWNYSKHFATHRWKAYPP